MRLSCNIELKRGVEIPSNFRQGLLSLIKESIKRGAGDGELFYRVWYSHNRQKPFTFSVFFPLKKVDGKSILDGDFFKFLFSTNSGEFIMRVYNGLLRIKESDFKLYGKPIKIKHCTLLPEKRFSKEIVEFKTISPLLIRDPKDGDYYLYPIEMQENINTQKFKYWRGVDIEEFKSVVRENLVRNAKKEIKLLDLKVEKITPVVCSSRKSNFTVTYPGIKAYLKVQARSEVLKYIYDTGIGARRSEGFGMLEVADE